MYAYQIPDWVLKKLRRNYWGPGEYVYFDPEKYWKYVANNKESKRDNLDHFFSKDDWEEYKEPEITDCGESKSIFVDSYEVAKISAELEELKLNYLKLSDAHTDSLEENEKLKAVVDAVKSYDVGHCGYQHVKRALQKLGVK